MTAQAHRGDEVAFVKRYASCRAAETAVVRSRNAREAGVRTAAVLDRPTPSTVSFQRIVPAATPPLAQMVLALGPLHGMRRDRLNRFDPFHRILPRQASAPGPVLLLASALKAQDTALTWSPAAVVHGDLHPGQLLVDGRKEVWLVDLDDLALARHEADLGNLAAWLATRAEGHWRAAGMRRYHG